MKRLLALIMCFLVAVVLFAGCGKEEKTEALKTNVYSVTDIEGSYKTQGRTRTTNKGLSLSHTAASFEFNAYCEGNVKINLSATSIPEESGYGVYFTVFVDGIRQRDRITVKKNEDITVTVAEKLERGEHLIQLFRQTENDRGNITFMSLELKGELRDAPKDNEILIEFIGDGLTTGYGNKASGNMSSLWGGVPLYQDGTDTYAFLAAREVGADISIVASEKMTLCCAEEDKLALELYESFPSSLGDTYIAERNPDVIVINLGTVDYFNRFTHEKSLSDIKAALLQFAKLVREKNPNAKIVLVGGMNAPALMQYTEAVVGELGGKAENYYFLQLVTNELGVDGYSNAEGQKQSATVLAEFLKNELGISATENK